MSKLEWDIINDDPNIIQLSFADSSSNYTPCFSQEEFNNLRKAVNDLINHYGEIEFCPKHSMVDPCDAGVLVSVIDDNGKYELQFHDGKLWAQIQFNAQEWEVFKKDLNAFQFIVKEGSEAKQ
jgi:hypothetical protein